MKNLFPSHLVFIALSAQAQTAVHDKDLDCYGFKDSKDNLIIGYQYFSAWDFSEGLAAVHINKKSGYIDKNNKVIIPMIYDWTYPFSEGLAPVEPNKKFKIIDKKRTLAIPLTFERTDEFSQGLAAVEPVAGQGYGYINKKGEMVIPPQFKIAYPFYDDTALVATAKKSPLHIDKTGKIVDGDKKSTTQPAVATKPASTSATNVQLSPNFTAEVKALLTTDKEQMRGAQDKSSREAIWAGTYYCTLPLTGFSVMISTLSGFTISADNKDLDTKNKTAAIALMDEMAKRLSTLGFKVLDSKTNTDILEKNQVRRIVFSDKS